ncbi:MAG: 6-phosphogluconolactonase [Saprospiraceae bacterium]|uniref:6-phosphogluconolactonase n=1 Tax=Candidatus Opimibacter skivensis TaxID=2982028 RepID=A0A9D7XTG2_9BACT|nr:6-phosphogluconolactonase [Candidatus Opimibacter skivensis]
MTKQSPYNLSIFQTVDELNHAAAEFIIVSASASLAAHGKFVIALSGGQTPQKIYSLLAEPAFRKKLDWTKIFIFWGDERCVPLNDVRNNAHQALSVLLDKVPIPPGNIHRIKVNLSPKEAAMHYQRELQHFFGKNPKRFDLILLGLGDNGHTASLFPGTSILDNKNSGVESLYVEEDKMHRVSMTAPLINQAHKILFLVTGPQKAGVLNTVLNGPFQPALYPAQLINPVDGELFWMVDQSAASQLDE